MRAAGEKNAENSSLLDDADEAVSEADDEGSGVEKDVRGISGVVTCALLGQRESGKSVVHEEEEACICMCVEDDSALAPDTHSLP